MCVCVCVFVRLVAECQDQLYPVVKGLESIGKSQTASKPKVLPARQLQEHLERKTFGTKNVLGVETAEIGLG